MLARLKFDISDMVNAVMCEVNDPDGYYLDIAMGGGQFVSAAEAIATPARVVGWENNRLRVNYAKHRFGLQGEYSVCDPRKEFTVDVSKLNVVGNWPFTSGTGRAPIAVGIMDNLLKNGIPKSMGVVLHSGFLHSADGGLARLRDSLFDAGLYKIMLNDVSAFEDGGAKVRTVTVFCKRDYDGPITVMNSHGSYDYDFRKRGYIVDGGTGALTQWLCDLRDRGTPVLGYQPKNHKDGILSVAVDAPQQGYEPFLRKMSVKGNDIAYAPASAFGDRSKSESWRVVVGYRPSGLEMGDPRFGLTTIVPPGTHVLNSPYVCIEAASHKHAQDLRSYFHSDIVENYILPRTRTSPTLDCKKKDGQTKFLPMLPPDVEINGAADITAFLRADESILAEMAAYRAD